MAFTNNINTSTPSGTENANTLDDIARGIKLEVKERFDSLTTGCDIDPMRLKAGAIPASYALTTPALTSPVITGIGQVLYAVQSATNSGIALNTATTILTIASVPAGTWHCETCLLFSNNVTGTGIVSQPNVSISDSINSAVIWAESLSQTSGAGRINTLAGGCVLVLSAVRTVTLSATLSVSGSGLGGTLTINGTSTDGRTWLKLTRLA
jgi:hypothetical protein